MASSPEDIRNTMIDAAKTYFHNHGRDVDIVVKQVEFGTQWVDSGVFRIHPEWRGMMHSTLSARAYEVWLVPLGERDAIARVCVVDEKSSIIPFRWPNGHGGSTNVFFGVLITRSLWKSTYDTLESLVQLDSKLWQMVSDLARRVHALEDTRKVIQGP